MNFNGNIRFILFFLLIHNAISDDKDQLEDTWFEWNESFRRFEADLPQRGIEYEGTLIDIDELI